MYGEDGVLLGELSANGAVQREYVRLGHLPLGAWDGATGAAQLLYFHTDHLGRPLRSTDANDVVQWDGQHTPFGEMASVVGARVVELAFPGQRRDPETGLAYNWNRYYDPALGRYLQPDPIGLDGGWNRYLYARANPIAFTDFAGLFTDADHHGSRTFEGPTAAREAEDANFELFCLIAPAAKGLSAARSATAAAGEAGPKPWNPFKGKSPEEIADMFEANGYHPRPSRDAWMRGKANYFNPKTGRGFHNDTMHGPPKGPHIGGHRSRYHAGPMKGRTKDFSTE